MPLRPLGGPATVACGSWVVRDYIAIATKGNIRSVPGNREPMSLIKCDGYREESLSLVKKLIFILLNYSCLQGIS